MRDDYTRLVRKGSPYDFSDTAENYQGYHTVNNIDISDNDENFDAQRKEVVNLSDVDPLKLSGVIQNIVFDLYGTNLPNNKEKEVIESLPAQVPNNIEMFELMLTKALRNLKVYEWVDREEDTTAPQELQEEVEQIVDTGESGDIDKQQIDEKLNEEDQNIQTQQTVAKMSPKERAKITQQINNELNQVQSQRYNQNQHFDPTQKKRSLEQAKLTRPSISGERAELAYLKQMTSDRTLEGWDIGTGKGGAKLASSSGSSSGGGASSDGWFSVVQNGGLSGDGAFGLPTIDCDKIGGV